MNLGYLVIGIFFLLSCGAEPQTEDNNKIVDEHPAEEDFGYDTDMEMAVENDVVVEEKSLVWDADSFDVELDKGLSSDWTYGKLFQVVMSEFPEAYEDFVEISYEKVEDKVNPDIISFLIPTKKLEKIDSVNIQTRFDRVALKMHDSVGCQWYEIGESETYSWSAWNDKEVTRIYYHFMFGC